MVLSFLLLLCTIFFVITSTYRSPVAQQATAEFTLILEGLCGVGKSTFMKRHLTGEFEKKHRGIDRLMYLNRMP